MNFREIALMAPLALLMLILGFAPNPFLKKSEPATQFILDTIESKRIAATEAAAMNVATLPDIRTSSPDR